METGVEVREVETLEVELGVEVREVETLEVEMGVEVGEVEILEVETGVEVREVETLEVGTGAEVREVETLEVEMGVEVRGVEKVEVEVGVREVAGVGEVAEIQEVVGKVVAVETRGVEVVAQMKAASIEKYQLHSGPAQKRKILARLRDKYTSKDTHRQHLTVKQSPCYALAHLLQNKDHITSITA